MPLRKANAISSLSPANKSGGVDEIMRFLIAWIMGLACYSFAVVLSPFRDTFWGAFHLMQGALISTVAVALAIGISGASSRVVVFRLLNRAYLPPRLVFMLFGLVLMAVSRARGFSIGSGSATELHFGGGTLVGLATVVLAAFGADHGTNHYKGHNHAA